MRMTDDDDRSNGPQRGNGLSYEDFIDTREDCADIGARIGADFYGSDDVIVVAGYVYLGVLYIERNASGYCLEIANCAYESAELAELELRLYEWACDEGYCD